MRLIVHFFLLFSFSAFGQKYADKSYYLIDSLDLSKVSEADIGLIESNLKEYHKSDNDSLKYQFVDHIIEGSWDVEIWPKYNEWMYFDVKKKLAKKNEYSLLEQKNLKSVFSAALNNFGYLADSQSKSDEAIEYYQQALEIDIMLGDKVGVSQILNNIAGVLQKQGKIKESLDYGLKALQLREQLLDSAGMAQSYNNIGSTYDDIGGNDSLSKDYILKSYRIRKAIGDEMGAGICLMNIANTECLMGQNDSAFIHFREANAVFIKYNNLFGQAYIYNNFGESFARMEAYDSAKVYFHKAIELREKIGDQNGLGQSLNSISLMYLQILNGKSKKDPKEVENIQKYAEAGLELGKRIGIPSLVQTSSLVLVRVYALQNRASEAVEMYDLSMKMKDSLHGVESQAAVIASETKYAYEKQKAIDDITRDKEVAIEKAQKAKQRVVIVIVSIGSVILIILLGFIFNRLRLTNKQKKEIESQKEKIDLQHKALEETHEEIKDSINYAKRIQTAILPSYNTVKRNFPDSFVTYIPKDVVAGDFYWTQSFGNQNLIAAADCTGHGVPGALVSVVCNNCLNRSVKEFGLRTPAEILNKTRDLVIEEFEKSDEEVKDGMDIAMISIEANKLQFAGANNPLWILREGELIEIKGDKQPIGKHIQMQSFTNHEFDLKTNDILYIFSDGFSDQFGGDKGKKMKSSNMKKLILAHGGMDLTTQKETLEAKFHEWMGDFAQLDDVCLIGVKIG